MARAEGWGVCSARFCIPGTHPMDRRLSRRSFLAAAGLAAALRVLGARPARAAPARYRLDPARSSVRFEADFGPDRITGDMPVSAAELTLDFADVANSRVAVRLDATRARASFPFAAQALIGPKVLDIRHHPEIGFRSKSVRRAGEGARIAGEMTIRGVTRPVTLDAAIWRQRGTAPGDLSHLTIRLTGRLSRSAFGATGWSDMVGDEVRIDILARIDRAG